MSRVPLPIPRRWPILAVLLLVALPLTGFHRSQNVPPQVVAILVRDLAGSPLEGIGIGVYEPGPSGVRLDRGSTDGDGFVRFRLPAGSYLVTFEGGWGTHTFVPPAEQNAGAMTTERSGGYAIQVEVQSQGSEALFLFTIGLDNTGHLVPLFDLSASPGDPPLPYLYDGPISDEVSIDPSPVSGLTQATLAAPGIAAVENAPRSTPAPGRAGVDSGVIGLIIMLVVVVLILLVLIGVLIRQIRGTGEEI